MTSKPRPIPFYNNNNPVNVANNTSTTTTATGGIPNDQNLPRIVGGSNIPSIMDRELRSSPDDAEPSSSYEKESFFGPPSREDQVEEVYDFHSRIKGSRTYRNNSNNNNNNNNFHFHQYNNNNINSEGRNGNGNPVRLQGGTTTTAESALTKSPVNSASNSTTTTTTGTGPTSNNNGRGLSSRFWRPTHNASSGSKASSSEGNASTASIPAFSSTALRGHNNGNDHGSGLLHTSSAAAREGSLSAELHPHLTAHHLASAPRHHSMTNGLRGTALSAFTDIVRDNTMQKSSPSSSTPFSPSSFTNNDSHDNHHNQQNLNRRESSASSSSRGGGNEPANGQGKKKKQKNLSKKRSNDIRRKQEALTMGSNGDIDDPDEEDNEQQEQQLRNGPSRSSGPQQQQTTTSTENRPEASAIANFHNSITPSTSSSIGNGSGIASLSAAGFRELNIAPPSAGNLDRSSSDQSTGSLLYVKTPSTGAMFGQSAAGHSLIFPTGVDQHASPLLGRQVGGGISSIGTGGGSVGTALTDGLSSVGPGGAASDADQLRKQSKINMALDQCESVRFPFKKKLVLEGLGLRAEDIPLKFLVGTALGNSLHKLSLSGNRLGTVPELLVVSLPLLKHLDLSQCELNKLPEKWYLPKLTKLNLSHNRFTEFPEEAMLEGLPELQDLNMYGNKVAEIIVPNNPKLLTKLETLNLGYNDLVYLPPELDQLKSLRTLKVMNNFLPMVPMRICDMEQLKTIDVSSNPVTKPPIETCERGIASMRRYWQCIRSEEQNALEEAQNKLDRQGKRKGGGRGSKGLMLLAGLKAKTSPGGVRRTLNNDNSLQTTTPTPVALATASSTTVGAVPRSKPTEGEKNVYSNPFSLAPDTPSAPVLTSAISAPVASTGESALLHSVKGERDSVAQTSTTQSQQPLVSGEGPLLDPKDVTHADFCGLADSGHGYSASALAEESHAGTDKVTVNDTLKVIFVGMAMVGKTSMIKRLIEGKDAVVPTHDERTVGVDIYEWDPKTDRRFEHIDSRINFEDEELAALNLEGVNVKFSVWDFAGQHVYHATHELFFSQRALYVLVWDMGATNPATQRRQAFMTAKDTGAFTLEYDSSEEEEDDGDGVHRYDDTGRDCEDGEESCRADRALERDIDDKVQFWVDCIQSTVPGAAILPVASFSDYFESDPGEARRRCNMMKQRLMKHEERRIAGLRQRLRQFHEQNRADDPAASRLRKLLCPFQRPKLIFGHPKAGGGNDSVVRVSGTKYTGFDHLTEKIIGIATGRDRGEGPEFSRYPIFHGHVGARIPRMRLQVREVVRGMRKQFKVVEWGYFVKQLQTDYNISSVGNISDALHFLTNTGELSYFGSVVNTSSRAKSAGSTGTSSREDTMHGSMEDLDMDDMDDDDQNVLSMEDTSITAPVTEDGSLTTVEDWMNVGSLSQFIFLNPRWLVAAVACILRHNLYQEIKETRRRAQVEREGSNEPVSPELGFQSTLTFYSAHSCPVITAEDAFMLWQRKELIKKAANRAQEYSNNMTLTPFEFLQLLLIRFGVFVPIDLSIEKACLGGHEYSTEFSAVLTDGTQQSLQKLQVVDSTPPVFPTSDVSVDTQAEDGSGRAQFFFLPSLLGPSEPADTWTYKNPDSWKTTLCHALLFPDGVPPGLMERLTATVLSSLYAVSNSDGSVISKDVLGKDFSVVEGKVKVKEVFCWRAAFFIKIGTIVRDGQQYKESVVEIFCHLADKDSRMCVGSDYMPVGMRSLIVSGRGQVGDHGRKIWKGGYLLVLKCIGRVMETYGGLEFEKQGFCPECLAKRTVGSAMSWTIPTILLAVKNGDHKLRCQHGHQVDTGLVAGPYLQQQHQKRHDAESAKRDETLPVSPELVSVRDLLRAVVVVGLYDGRSRQVVRVGSGFVIDKKRGLIVTAAHTLINIWGDRAYPFGENYYGLREGKVVIGVIPEGATEDLAVFRYFGKIVAKDESLDRGECHLDACVIQITTRLENDVSDGNGEGCGDQPEILLLNNEHAMKNEQLKALKITSECELDEQVRVLGYNQGGEGLLQPGEVLNRYFDFARGYVCMKFDSSNNVSDDNTLSTTTPSTSESSIVRRFQPNKEIVVICPTIGGHSGGPCVNQQGEVIGILSRADPTENHRCYISPTQEWKGLIRQAKKANRM